MPKFTSGIANNGDDMFTIIETQLLANGWSVIDSISDVVDNRDKVYKGTSIEATVDAAPVVRVVWNGTTLYRVVYTDWDAALNVGANDAGTTSTNVNISASPFSYWIRVNGSAFGLVTQVSGVYSGTYAGNVRRGLPANQAGLTKLSAGTSIGVTSLPVTTDMTGKLFVGQNVLIVDKSGDSTSGTWENIEQVTIQAVSASTITITAPTTKAFSINSVVGMHPTNVVSDTNVSAGSPMYGTHLISGYTTASPTGLSLSVTYTGGDTNQHNDPGGAGTRTVNPITVFSGNTNGTGTLGTLYHLIGGAFQGTNPQDTLDEGDGVVAATILNSNNTNGLAMQGN